MPPSPKTITQLRRAFQKAAQALAEHQRAMQGDPPHLAGKAEVDVLTPAPGEILVIRLPSHTDPHICADLARFVRDQLDAVNLAVPVIVTLADSVTAEKPEA